MFKKKHAKLLIVAVILVVGYFVVSSVKNAYEDVAGEVRGPQLLPDDDDPSDDPSDDDPKPPGPPRLKDVVKTDSVANLLDLPDIPEFQQLPFGRHHPNPPVPPPSLASEGSGPQGPGDDPSEESKTSEQKKAEANPLKSIAGRPGVYHKKGHPDTEFFDEQGNLFPTYNWVDPSTLVEVQRSAFYKAQGKRLLHDGQYNEALKKFMTDPWERNMYAVKGGDAPHFVPLWSHTWYSKEGQPLYKIIPGVHGDPHDERFIKLKPEGLEMQEFQVPAAAIQLNVEIPLNAIQKRALGTQHMYKTPQGKLTKQRYTIPPSNISL